MPKILFQRGQSGNPGGRPKSSVYATAAREFLAAAPLAGPDAPESWGPAEWGPIETWTNAQRLVHSDYRWAIGGDGPARNALLDRGEGPVRHELEISREMPLEEAEAIIAEHDAQLAQGSAPVKPN